jgi:aldehyde:ferredoxin oxidoreductase
MGKILRVNLTTGKDDENLPEEPVLKKFIGGQALALYILMHELPLDATPFGPEKQRGDDDRAAHRQRLHSRRHQR